MSVNKTTFRGKEVITIDGKVDAFYINPIKPEHIKTYAGKNGAWTPCFRYNLVVDGQAISLGMGEKDGVSDRQNIQAKDNDGKYHTLVKGLEVSVEVEEKGEYQGKPQYQSSNSKVVVIDASGAEAPQQKNGNSGSSQGYVAKPKDMTGIEAGQAVNGAMNFLITYGVDPSNENILEYGRKVHNVTTKVKEQYKKDNSEVSDYDSGARCGLAVLTACKLVGTEQDFESGILSIANDILSNVLGPITEYVKTPQKDSPAPKQTRATPAKKSVTKAKPVIEEVAEDLEDDGQDLPF